MRTINQHQEFFPAEWEMSTSQDQRCSCDSRTGFLFQLESPELYTLLQSCSSVPIYSVFTNSAEPCVGPCAKYKAGAQNKRIIILLPGKQYQGDLRRETTFPGDSFWGLYRKFQGARKMFAVTVLSHTRGMSSKEAGSSRKRSPAQTHRWVCSWSPPYRSFSHF